MSDVKTPETATPIAEVKVETPATATAEVVAAPVVEAPKAKLAPGLFQGFTLGSSLTQGPTGNLVVNTKKSPMDYEKTYKQATKNVQMTHEQLKEAVGKK